MAALDMSLDIMGEQPALFKLYTQLCFIYATQDSTLQSEIVKTLESGLVRLCESFPWVAGQVVNTNPDLTGSPTYRLQSFKRIPTLVIKDYTGEKNVPTLDTLKDAEYPMAMLHESTWAPCPTLATLGFDPTQPSGDALDPAPVLLLQASFIRGGLVLCINMQHNVADMSGQESVIRLLSKACSGEDFTHEETKIGNAEREGLISLINEEGWKPGTELEQQLFSPQKPASSATQAPPTKITTPDPPAPPKCTWAYFSFGPSSLRQLKHLATQTLPEWFKGYVTTDDAVTACIYQSVLRARFRRLSHDPDCEVTIARAVDARRYLNVPATYPGILQNMAYTSYPLSRLLSMRLGEVAADMRQQVDPKKSNLAYATRSLITFLSQAPEHRSKVSFSANLKLDSDVMLSSWSKVDAYSFDFGLGLGQPEAVRRPGFLPVESLFYLMPKAKDGEIAAALCLRDEDMESLRNDEQFARFSRYIG